MNEIQKICCIKVPGRLTEVCSGSILEKAIHGQYQSYCNNSHDGCNMASTTEEVKRIGVGGVEVECSLSFLV